MPFPALTYVTSLDLKYREDCSILGVTKDLTVYVEEIYSEDAWIAQQAISIKGDVLDIVDEDYGNNTNVQPIALNDVMATPSPGWHCMALNFAGPRRRGLRGPERITDTVLSIPVSAKMKLAKKLDLRLPAPMILGISESYVISEIELKRPNLYFICRRIRVVYALPEEKTDEHNQPYDYDTVTFYVAHLYDKNDINELTLEDALGSLPGAPLNRPMDCVLYDNHIFIADGGSDDRKSMVHVWEVDLMSLQDETDDNTPSYL